MVVNQPQVIFQVVNARHGLFWIVKHIHHMAILIQQFQQQLLIDGIVIAIPTFMLIGVTGISDNLEPALLSNDAALVADVFSRFQSEVQLLVFLVSAVYNVFFMVYFNGQTLGKIMLGLRVVKKNGRRISWLDALLRNVLGYTVSGIFLLGYIWALFDREKQAWHDKMAGTVVVDERA